MVIPFISYILGLIVVGFVHTLLNPVSDALFEASNFYTSGLETLLRVSVQYFPVLYAIVGALVLFLYSQKSGRGSPF